MSDDRTPLDELIDLVLYAPLGLVSNLRAELPRLAERGRQEWASKTAMYKMMGQFAVKEAQNRAEKSVKEAQERLADLGATRPSPPAPAPHTAAASAPAPPPAPEAPATNGARPKPDADALGIPGYDSLSASQVVQRLAGLSRDELAAVEEYERASRGRRTVLNRVAQLRDA